MIDSDVVLRVGGITEMSTVDWYGNVSMVLFMAGCNLRCPYCQNSTLIPPDSGQEVSLDYIREQIETGMKPVPQLDALVITGGEPLLQPEGVLQAAKLAREYGLKIMLDTNGTISDNLDMILRTGLIDRVALDVKAPLNPEDYGIIVGKPDKGKQFSLNVRNSLNICKEYEVELEVRTTVVPGLSDSPDFIRRIAREIKGVCNDYYLQQFDNSGDILNHELKSVESPKREHMIHLAKIAIETGLDPVYIKTRLKGLEKVI
jgi:pyruvate formate lyase activating enzyme